jgi:ABC-type uncharacterized transport system permease subunit
MKELLKLWAIIAAVALGYLVLCVSDEDIQAALEKAIAKATGEA